MGFIRKWGKPYYKVGQALLPSGEALVYCDVGQVLLQSRAAFLYDIAGQVVFKSRAGITKWDNVYHKKEQVLQSRATFITKWARYYKVGTIIRK